VRDLRRYRPVGQADLAGGEIIASVRNPEGALVELDHAGQLVRIIGFFGDLTPTV
jgi:hypothetical protein